MEYFSFLRPLAELQIAHLFSTFTQYHEVFRSCNVGSKSDKWCANCAKCLFVYIILSPFLSEEKMVHIFGENLLEKKELIDIFEQLVGLQQNKPFECVGSTFEARLALKMLENNTRLKEKQKMPLLLNHLIINGDFTETYEYHVTDYETSNGLPKEFETILKTKLRGVSVE